MKHAYWGKGYDVQEADSFLKQNDIRHIRLDNEDRLLERVADAIYQGKAAGWFQGRFEWGPRALGNRSIFANPDKPEMKDIVNTKIKFREPFRPFAPLVLVEKAAEYLTYLNQRVTIPLVICSMSWTFTTISSICYLRLPT
jgi:carbamoyltransferase